MRVLAGFVVVALASSGRADPFPARGGESGLLDVPDAEVLPLGGADFAGELRLAEGWDPGAGVSPHVAIVTGLGLRLEAGVAAREGGRPGDPLPSPALFGAAVKLGVLAPRGARPGLAVDAVIDRVNRGPGGAARLIASTGRVGPLRVALFGGAGRVDLGEGAVRATYGAAAGLRWRRLELVGEAVRWPEGTALGGAVRWLVAPSFGVSVGATVEPETRRAFASLGVAVSVAPPPAPPRAATQVEEEVEGAAPPPSTKRGFTTPRPRFRLKIRPPEAAR